MANWLPSLQAIRREKSQRHLIEFIKNAWNIVERSPFIDGFHIGAVCEHLEAVTRGQIRNLLINVPPRHSKSLIVSVFWPAWEWALDSSKRWLFSSYAQKLATRDSVACRRLIESDWYSLTWPNIRLVGDQNEKTRFENVDRGVRIATCTSAGTGEGGQRIVCDDPHAVDDSLDVILETVSWWNTVMSTRLNDPKRDAQVVIGQRVHEKDLSGALIEQGGYEHLCIPAEYEPKRSKVTSLGWKDPRSEAGQLICEERFGRTEVELLKVRLGSYAAAGQLQQRPAPEGGGLIKIAWLRFYTRATLPASFDQVLASWDMSFAGKDTSDWVVGQVWGRRGADKYLLHQLRKKLNMPDSVKAVKAMHQQWPIAQPIVIEAKANGQGVIDTLRHEVPGLLPENPKDSKIARLNAHAPAIEAGNVWLPDPNEQPWVKDLLGEIESFPNGSNDDQVDCLTQALKRLKVQPFIREVLLPR